MGIVLQPSARTFVAANLGPSCVFLEVKHMPLDALATKLVVSCCVTAGSPTSGRVFICANLRYPLRSS